MSANTIERISLSLTKEEAKGGRRLRPEGTYIVSIDEVEFTKSSAGNPMYVFTSSFIDGPEGGTNGSHKLWAVLTEAAKFTIVDVCRATGFKMEPGEFTVPAPEEFEGKEFAFDIVHEPQTEGKGKDKTQVLDEDGKPVMTDNTKKIRSVEAANKSKSASGAAKARTRRL